MTFEQQNLQLEELPFAIILLWRNAIFTLARQDVIMIYNFNLTTEKLQDKTIFNQRGEWMSNF